MITQTLESVLTRFGLLRSKVDEVITVDTLRYVRSSWVGYRGRRNPYSGAVSIAGIDSGYNYIEYRGFALYVANTVSVFISNGVEDHVDSVVDVDIVSTSNLEHELSLLSICMEVSSMARLAAKADLVLVDGSLLSMFLRLYRASIDNGLEVLDSKGINVVQVLKNLVYAVSLSPRKFLFVSKNSNSKDLLGLVKGDIYYLERYTGFAPGYTKPLDLVYSKHLGVATIARQFKRYAKNLTGLDLSIALTYARFEDFARVYRIEFALGPGEEAESIIRSAFDVLSSVSISGYPYPLARAHSLAKIGNRDVERVAVLLGIAGDPRSREAFLM